jgi:catechol 2,3-dioxygenase-like lactoylglutathione lyase family enzyme
MKCPSIDQQITFLMTDDLEATARFYEDVLVLRLKLDQGACRIYQAGAAGYIGFCQRAEPAEAAPAPDVILTLVTEEVDEWYRYLQEQGIVFEKPPQTNLKYNIYHCFLRDPNGYLIEIQRFLHPFD